MNKQRWLMTLLMLGALAPANLAAQTVEPPPAAAGDISGATPGETSVDEEGLDVLTRGPVHEAFAEQVNPDPEPGLTVDQAPPPDVNELPPDIKPDGDDVVWIPGYWFWDDDREDYVWISGLWRRIPPGRRWVPGYWQETEVGHQWIPGFWDSGSREALDYVEPPPESLEVGPSSPAPSEDHFWIPGNWVLGEAGYGWSPGFWQTYVEGWTWVCPRYVWTPGGCVYVSGYWDYPITRRGCLFAPVHFRRPLYLTAGWFYRPRCWIGHTALLQHLWVRPFCGHYYFGDYYASLYRGRRFIHCYDYFRRHRGFDCLYTYYGHYYRRRGINYHDRVHRWHDYYRRHPDRRPAHTLADQRRRHQDPLRGVRRPHDSLGQDWFREAGRSVGGRVTRRVDGRERDRLVRSTDQIRDIARQRQRGETPRRLPEGLSRRTEGGADRRPPTARSGSSLADRISGSGTAGPRRDSIPSAAGNRSDLLDRVRRSAGTESADRPARRLADRIQLPKPLVESKTRPQPLVSTDRAGSQARPPASRAPGVDADRIFGDRDRLGRSERSRILPDAGRSRPSSTADARPQLPGTRSERPFTSRTDRILGNQVRRPPIGLPSTGESPRPAPRTGGSERPSLPRQDQSIRPGQPRLPFEPARPSLPRQDQSSRPAQPRLPFEPARPSRSVELPQRGSPVLRQQSPSSGRSSRSTPRIGGPTSSRPPVAREFSPSFSVPRSISPSRSSRSWSSGSRTSRGSMSTPRLSSPSRSTRSFSSPSRSTRSFSSPSRSTRSFSSPSRSSSRSFSSRGSSGLSRGSSMRSMGGRSSFGGGRSSFGSRGGARGGGGRGR